MPQGDSQQRVLPSLLDRLVDEEPDVSTEPLWKDSHTVRELKEAVRRDLENLMNTRQTRPEFYGETHECARSVLAYGVPDFTARGLDAEEEQNRLCQWVQQAVGSFESRLTEVRVQVSGPASQQDRTIHLVISGILHAEPIVEPVTFDTVVETSTGNCHVKTGS